MQPFFIIFIKMSNEFIIQPSRLHGEPELPPIGLFCINPDEARHVVQSAKQQGGKKETLFNSELVIVNNERRNYFVAGPSVGAPMAVITLEKLIALGAKYIIVYSWCGSLSESLAVEDVFLPQWGYSEEGTSSHYPVEGKSSASNELNMKLALFLEKKEFLPKTGAIWTTDAPYRESRQKAETLRDNDIVAVDMEFTALSTVAIFRQVRLAAVMLVSDELWQDTWTPGFKRKSFRKKSRVVIDTLFEFCSTTKVS